MSNQENPERVINHRKMRVIVGLIALALPPVVVFFSGYDGLSSISISYWTDSRDLFVGAMFAVGFYLAAYRGPGRCNRLEKRLSRVAGVCAVCIALVPTTGFTGDDIPARWILAFTNLLGIEPVLLHRAAALILFACLAWLLLVFSSRASRKGKEFRSFSYLALSLGIAVGLPVLYLVLEKGFHLYDTIFYVEWVGLWLFGIGWFLAGAYSSEVQEVPEHARLITEEPIRVDPGNPNNATGIKIDPSADAEYFFIAQGCWRDWYLHCSPEGWGPKWMPITRRLMCEPFFALCGNIGKSDQDAFNFCIGSRCAWSVPPAAQGLDDR